MASRTTLKQQVEIVKEIQKGSLIQGVKALREFLTDNGYEDLGDCKHHMIVRVSGKCSSCGVPVAEPMPLGSDESLLVLRQKLRND